jgi:hypothetical protein
MKLTTILLGLALLAGLSTTACSRHSIKGSAALNRAYGHISTSVARNVDHTTRRIESLRLVK